MAALVLGIALGCFMFAFVNNHYNDKKWIDSRYIFGLGLTATVIGLIMLL